MLGGGLIFINTFAGEKNNFLFVSYTNKDDITLKYKEKESTDFNY